MNLILTEQEVKNCLAISEYPMKYKSALAFAAKNKNEKMFWTNVRQHFLELGGLFKHQLYNNGNIVF